PWQWSKVSSASPFLLRSVATAAHREGMAASLHRRDHFVLLLRLFLSVFRIMGVLGLRMRRRPGVKIGDEAAVVDAADVLRVPQLHRVDLQRVLVLAHA